MTVQQRMEAIMKTQDPSFKGSIAIAKEIIIYRNQKEKINLRILKERIASLNIVMYTPKNSYLVDALNSKIETFNSAGLIAYWQSKVVDLNLHNQHECEIGQQKLTFQQLSGSFQLLVFGILLALAVFFCELTSHYCRWKFIACCLYSHN